VQIRTLAQIVSHLGIFPIPRRIGFVASHLARPGEAAHPLDEGGSFDWTASLFVRCFVWDWNAEVGEMACVIQNALARTEASLDLDGPE